MRLVFFGSPTFAARTLQYLLGKSLDVVAVVTQPPKPKGRSGKPVPTPVAQLARAHDIPLLEPAKASDPSFIEQIARFQADLFVVVAYGAILKESLLNLPPLGCVNVHASLLPAYRGAAPIQRALIDGVDRTGVSIMYLALKMDAGDVIRTLEVEVGPNTNREELENELCEVGSVALVEVIQDLTMGRHTRHPQDHTKATYASKISSDECRLDWTQPATVLHNLVRGVYRHPGAWCSVTIGNRMSRLKVHVTRVVSVASDPGEIVQWGPSGVVIGCGDQALELVEVQPDGKRSMEAGAWACGTRVDEICFEVLTEK